MSAEHKTESDLARTNGQDHEATNLEAIKEAARLGTIDTYLVDTDMEDKDEREDTDQPDGRASPMANADNPER